MALSDKDRAKLARLRGGLKKTVEESLSGVAGGSLSWHPSQGPREVREPERAVVIPQSNCSEPDGQERIGSDEDLTKHQAMIAMGGQCPWCGGDR